MVDRTYGVVNDNGDLGKRMTSLILFASSSYCIEHVGKALDRCVIEGTE